MYRVRDLLEQDRLARLRWGNDQAPLAETDGRKQVNDPAAEISVLPLEGDASIRIAGLEVVERNPVLGGLGISEIYTLHLKQRQVAFPFLGRPYLTQHRIPRSQVEPLDLAGAHIDVVGSVQIVPVLAAEKAVPLRENLQDTLPAQNGVSVEE